MPERIQRRRTKGWRMPPGAVYVGRPTKWGNPYSQMDLGHEDAVWNFRRWIEQSPMGPEFAAEARHELAGRDLACWCPADLPCHADVLLEIANQEAPTHG